MGWGGLRLTGILLCRLISHQGVFCVYLRVFNGFRAFYLFLGMVLFYLSLFRLWICVIY